MKNHQDRPILELKGDLAMLWSSPFFHARKLRPWEVWD